MCVTHVNGSVWNAHLGWSEQRRANASCVSQKRTRWHWPPKWRSLGCCASRNTTDKFGHPCVETGGWRQLEIACVWFVVERSCSCYSCCSCAGSCCSGITTRHHRHQRANSLGGSPQWPAQTLQTCWCADSRAVSSTPANQQNKQTTTTRAHHHTSTPHVSNTQM